MEPGFLPWLEFSPISTPENAVKSTEDGDTAMFERGITLSLRQHYVGSMREGLGKPPLREGEPLHVSA